MKLPDGYKLTQTALKDLEKDSTCPDRWRALWLDKEIEFPSNEDMDKGKFFEQICIGGSAVANDIVTDLPRTANGKKTIDQIRIEEQAARFKRMLDPNDPDFQGHEIIDSQVEIIEEDRKGTIDFVSKDLEGNIWINDLKLTKDANSTRSQYGWGNEWSSLDLIQLVHYSDLYENKYGIKPKIGLWVFDYSPLKNIKIGQIIISNRAIGNKNLRFDAAIEVIGMYREFGWSKLPSEKECNACILQCASRFKGSEIQKLIVNI